jgi:hypothetical protein
VLNGGQIYRSLDNRSAGVAARQLLCCLGVLWLLTATCVCSAQVQLPTVNLGDTNFEDAFGGPVMHKFWGLTDPVMAQVQMIMFMKNLSMFGGALLITQFGAGPLSLDARRSR